jgi:membrane protein involved in colicin uptake
MAEYRKAENKKEARESILIGIFIAFILVALLIIPNIFR